MNYFILRGGPIKTLYINAGENSGNYVAMPVSSSGKAKLRLPLKKNGKTVTGNPSLAFPPLLFSEVLTSFLASTSLVAFPGTTSAYTPVAADNSLE